MLFAQLLLSLSPGAEAPEVDFRTEVLPILKARCIECHQDPATNAGKRPKAGLRLDGKHWILQGAKGDPVIVPGAPEESTLYELIALDADDPDRMPPKGDALSPLEIDTLRKWIAEGATFGDWVGVPGQAVKVSPTPKPPTGKLPRTIRQLLELGEGVQALSETAIKAAAGERGTIQPVFPGSPLLSVSFPSHQGRTGTRDIAGLSAIAENIAVLDMGRTRITDKALETVAKMSRLVKLDLRQTNINDEALTHLKGLTHLRSLNLFGTPVTDASLTTIAELTKLETVYLWQSKITSPGAKKLRSLRPDVRVVSESVLPPPEKRDPEEGARGRRRKS